MEPRPQRPRAQSGQATQSARQVGPPQSAPHPSYTTGEYPPGADPTSFIAPARTEYDYSPLDLAPPGQRRRRQLVAAAVGALSVLLLGAIIFFSYLLLRDEEPPSQNDDLLAAQTEVAQQQATLDAQSTVVAQAAAEQTQQAQALSGTEAPAETPAGDATEGAEPTAPAAGATEGPESTAAAGSADQTPDAPAQTGDNASLNNDQLVELLPAPEQVPEQLTEVNDASRTLEEVIEALGGGRPAESNLEEWGWSGNVERQFSVADPEGADPATTTYLAVSIHGFADPASAEAALPFFSDILVNASGYSEGELPAEFGDNARLLSMTDEEGKTNVTLYVQEGAVLYRILGFSTAGDPTQDVVAVATAMFGE